MVSGIGNALSSINRIRLEFKVNQLRDFRSRGLGINRIRLEFKGLPADPYSSGTADRINRIRLEFKEPREQYKQLRKSSINRIRLEFKGNMYSPWLRLNLCINRIRLEFKAESIRPPCTNSWVLIESDWNLKISTHYTQRTQLLY